MTPIDCLRELVDANHECTVAQFALVKCGLFDENPIKRIQAAKARVSAAWAEARRIVKEQENG